jgi:hypothetical protein
MCGSGGTPKQRDNEESQTRIVERIGNLDRHGATFNERPTEACVALLDEEFRSIFVPSTKNPLTRTADKILVVNSNRGASGEFCGIVSDQLKRFVADLNVSKKARRDNVRVDECAVRATQLALRHG